MRRILPTAVALALAALGVWVWTRGDADPPVAQTHGGRPAPSAPAFPGYDFSRPVASFELPAELFEISGLAAIDERTVVCVQDEIGTLYYVDLQDGAVTRSIPFAKEGDYEGLARVGEALWVVKSNGRLRELVPRDGTMVVVRKPLLELAHEDIEGLGYDPFERVLLVAPKDRVPGAKKQRHVFAFDPVSAALRAEPALDTSVGRIEAEARDAGLPLPTKVTKRGNVKPDLEVRFSAIAVHPLTSWIFALSAQDRAVLAFDRASTLRAVHFYEGERMPQVEGLTFLANGDLVVASEGRNAPARIEVYAYDPDR